MASIHPKLARTWAPTPSLPHHLLLPRSKKPSAAARPPLPRFTAAGGVAGEVRTCPKEGGGGAVSPLSAALCARCLHRHECGRDAGLREQRQRGLRPDLGRAWLDLASPPSLALDVVRAASAGSARRLYGGVADAGLRRAVCDDEVGLSGSVVGLRVCRV